MESLKHAVPFCALLAATPERATSYHIMLLPRALCCRRGGTSWIQCGSWDSLLARIDSLLARIDCLLARIDCLLAWIDYLLWLGTVAVGLHFYFYLQLQGV
jgi:hypothetical protein